MRMAKPTEQDQDAVLRFMQDLEEVLDYDGEGDVAEIVERHWPEVSVSWQRVYWAGLSAIQNACDPDLTYLEFKPEILAAMEKAKGDANAPTS